MMSDLNTFLSPLPVLRALIMDNAAYLLLFLQIDRRMTSSFLRLVALQLQLITLQLQLITLQLQLITLQLQLITHQLRLQLSHSNQVVLNPTLGFSPFS
jgi:hypothetical protein